MTLPATPLRERLRSLPGKPGVYMFRDKAGKLLYIGKAVSLANRVRHYFQKSAGRDPRLAAMMEKAADLEVIVTDSEVEALILETTLIKQHKPRYNIDLKDDKSYPYIVVTNEPFPRVFPTRRVIRDGSRYFGPYTDVGQMHSSLKLIRELYRIRSCNFFIDDEAIAKKKIKLCLDYHIGKCDGPCEGLVSQADYNAMVGEVTEILKGRTSRLAASLRKSMDDSAADMRFEDAARFRDRLRELSVYNDRQKVVDLKSDECDYAAVAVREDHGCAVVFKIREGKITGRPHFPLSGALDRPETEILGEFIDTYYLESTDVPPEVCVAAELPDREVVEEWLRQKRGGPVKIVRPRSGEKARLLEMCRKNAGMLLDMMMLQRAQQKRVPAALGILAKELRLPAEPHWIECFDVSHFQGSDTVGSVVVYNDGRPKKSEYRKFILSTAGPDDFASMRELVNRRYSRRLAEQEPLPDLIVIDGGKGQLSAAIESLDGLGLAGGPRAVREPVPVVGLAKKLEEIYLSTLSGLTPLSALTPVTAPGAVVTLPKTSPGLKLLQQLRNEAHRFGVTFHRNRRSGRILTTELDLVKGVGRKRATALLEAFGSVQGVRFATAGQLTEIVGEAVAARIQEYFSNMGPENGTFQETPTVG